MIRLSSRTLSVAALLGSAALGGAAWKSASRATAQTPVAAPAAVSASPLFAFRRDDGAPGGLTSVRIDAARQAPAPIQQNVFGNFIEHLGGVVYEGVWAQALLNPNLEKIDANDSAPQRWELSGATWQERGYVSPRCVRLNVESVLSQRIFLPVHRTRRYTLTLYAKAADGSILHLSLRAGGEPNGPVVWQASARVAGNWQKHSFNVTLPTGALQKGQASRLAVSAEGSAVDVDQIELFPNDAVDGLDPDVLRRAREWRIPTLRLAGNFSSGCHWRDGVGLHIARPTLRNQAWGGIEPNHFGTDEYLDFCRLIGATPQIAVNAGNGSATEAADWVRYVNRSPLRARVPIWEIGNELYGVWQIGHTDAPGNAQRFVAFRDAMLQVDPAIQIIATGKADEFLPAGLEHNRVWNTALLQSAKANGGRLPDWLSIHPLVPLPGGLDNFSYAERYESAMAHPAFVDRTLLPSVIQTIRDVEGPNAPTRIAPNEWGIIVGGDRWTEGPNHDVVAGAIFNALTLNAFLRHSDWVTLANMTALMHGGGIKKPNGVVMVDPQYYTQQLYAEAAPRFALATTWSGPGRDVPRRGFLPAVADLPNVDVFSALNADRSRLSAFVVNRSLDGARPVSLNVAGFATGRVTAQLLTAPDVQARNTWQQPDTVAPRPFALSAGFTRGQAVSLPPHSLVVFRFERAGR